MIPKSGADVVLRDEAILGAHFLSTVAYQSKKVVIPAAQVLTAFASPVQLLPALGGRNLYVINSCYASIGAGTAYATNTGVKIGYNGASGPTAIGAASLTALLTSSSAKSELIGGVAAETDMTAAIGQNVAFSVLVGNPTAGTSDVTVVLDFSVFDDSQTQQANGF